VASCLRGAFPPVDLRAVCLVRAMMVMVHALCFCSLRSFVGCGGSSGERARISLVRRTYLVGSYYLVIKDKRNE
jgi:hypothetical protein